jgi:uncharacterized FlaG/YvyC family protein
MILLIDLDAKEEIMLGVSIGAPSNVAPLNKQSDATPVQSVPENIVVPVNVTQKNADTYNKTVVKEPEPQKQTVKVEHDNIMASFEYDQHLKQVIITLRNNDNGEVVQQFPSEKVLKVLEGIMQSLQQVETVNAVDAKG